MEEERQRKREETAMLREDGGGIVRGNTCTTRAACLKVVYGADSYCGGPVTVTTGVARRFERVDEGSGRIVPGPGRRIVISDDSLLTIDNVTLKDGGLKQFASLEVSEDGSVRAASGILARRHGSEIGANGK